MKCQKTRDSPSTTHIKSAFNVTLVTTEIISRVQERAVGCTVVKMSVYYLDSKARTVVGHVKKGRNSPQIMDLWEKGVEGEMKYEKDR